MTTIDPRTAAYWPLDEQHDSVLPADAAGRVPDLLVPSGQGRPDVADQTITGFGRDFVRADSDALAVADGGALRLTRNVTVTALARLRLEDLTDGDLCTLVQRGRGGGADPVSFGVRVEVVDVAFRTCRLFAFWQTTAGVDVEDVGAVFVWPEPGQPEDDFMLLGVTREVANGKLVVRYQVNGETADGFQEHDLDCGGGAGADVALGAGMDGVSYEHRWDGVIDAVQVLNEAVLPEEFQWTWERMAYDIPAAIETMRKSVPPGVYSRDPDSRIQRELAVEGAALGHSKSLARRLRFYSLPETCFGEMLEGWEQRTGHSPKPGDHLALRRDRVVSFVRTKRGFQVDDVKAQLAEPFDLDAADVQILEFDNDYTQGFATDPGNAIVETGNLSSWTVGSGVLTADTGAAGTTNKDLRYGGAGNPRAGLYLWSLANGEDAWVAGKIDITVNNGDAIAGLVMGNRATDEWVFVGVRQIASAPQNDIVWLKYRAGILDATATVLQASWDTDPTFLRLRALATGEIEVRWGANAAAADADAPVLIDPDIGVPQWAGFCLVSPGNFAAENGQATFDDFLSHTPKGDQRFNWFAYRDPGEPGNPDIIGSRELVRRIKPAHTQASACTALVIECDDAGNGCGEAPIGL